MTSYDRFTFGIPRLYLGLDLGRNIRLYSSFVILPSSLPIFPA